MRAIRLGRPAHPRSAPRRGDIEPDPVNLMPAVLAERPVRKARNANGGTAITTPGLGERVGLRRIREVCLLMPAKRGRSAARAVVRRTERVQVILPADELAAIEEFRFQARMPSRSAAVRELLDAGWLVRLVPAVLANGALREARNADGGTAVRGFETLLFVFVANFFQRPVPEAIRVAFAGFRDLDDFLSDNFG